LLAILLPSLSGGADDAHGNQTELEAALNEGNADWETTRYAGVQHGFTAWGGGGYSLVADYRSWDSMMQAFEELLTGPLITDDDDDPTVSSTSGVESADSITFVSIAISFVVMLFM